jgi:hypothetical protein
MDLLDELAADAAALLACVDETLAAEGASAEHPVWPLLRRVRVLPGAAVRAVCALRPDEVTAVLTALRSAGSAVTVTDLPGPADWQGVAAERYDAERQALAVHLTDTVGGRIDATARLTADVAAWMTDARRDAAVALAEVLGSAEAVAVRLELAGAGDAAADIAVRVLTAVADAYDRAADLGDDSAGLTVPARYRD